jgi:hypothetical protein
LHDSKNGTRPEPVLLTVRVPEAGRLLGISSRLAYDLVACGKLPALSLGGRKVVSVIALAELVGTTPEDVRAQVEVMRR